MHPSRLALTTEIRKTLVLGAPVVVAQLAQMSMSFVDALMVGRLGSGQLAAVALGGSVFFPVVMSCLGLLAGTSPMVSQAHGAGRPEAVARSVRQGLWLSMLLFVPILLVLRNADMLFHWTGQDRATLATAQAYLKAIAWGSLPLLWFGVLRNFVEGLSRPRIVTVITLLGVALNISGNYVLIYGKLGFPALGVVGCGWATTIVYWSMLVVLVTFILWEPRLRSYGIFNRLGRPDREVLQELFRIGWPIGVAHGLESSLFATTAQLMGILGVGVLAAHQIALQCAAFSFMVPLGLSIAVAVRVGQAVGRKDAEGVRMAGYAGIVLGASFMAVTAVIFWTLPRQIVSLFLDLHNPQNFEVAQRAFSLLAIAGVFQVFDGVQVAAMGALRGLKDTRLPMIIALLSYWVIGMLSGTVLAFGLGLEGRGLWWGLVLGLGAAAVMLTLRFRRQVRQLQL